MNQDLYKQRLAEFIGTLVLIFVGIGAVYNHGELPRGLLGVALSHGVGIAGMLSVIGAISGGYLSPSRTLGVAPASGHWNNHRADWFGSLWGGGTAGLIYGRFLIADPK